MKFIDRIRVPSTVAAAALGLACVMTTAASATPLDATPPPAGQAVESTAAETPTPADIEGIERNNAEEATDESTETAETPAQREPEHDQSTSESADGNELASDPSAEAEPAAPELTAETEPSSESVHWAEWSIDQSRTTPDKKLIGAPGQRIKVDYTAKVRTTARNHTIFRGDFTIANKGATAMDYQVWLDSTADDREPLRLTCKWNDTDIGSEKILHVPAGTEQSISFRCEEYDLAGTNSALQLQARIAGSTSTEETATLELSYQDQDEHVIYTDRTVFAGAAGKETKVGEFDGWSADLDFTRTYTVPEAGCDESQGSSVILQVEGDEPEKLSHFLPQKICAAPTPPTQKPSPTEVVSEVKDEPVQAASTQLADTGADPTPLLIVAGTLLVSGIGATVLASRMRRRS